MRRSGLHPDPRPLPEAATEEGTFVEIGQFVAARREVERCRPQVPSSAKRRRARVEAS